MWTSWALHFHLNFRHQSTKATDVQSSCAHSIAKQNTKYVTKQRRTSGLVEAVCRQAWPPRGCACGDPSEVWQSTTLPRQGRDRTTLRRIVDWRVISGETRDRKQYSSLVKFKMMVLVWYETMRSNFQRGFSQERPEWMGTHFVSFGILELRSVTGTGKLLGASVDLIFASKGVCIQWILFRVMSVVIFSCALSFPPIYDLYCVLDGLRFGPQFLFVDKTSQVFHPALFCQTEKKNLLNTK